MELGFLIFGNFLFLGVRIDFGAFFYFLISFLYYIIREVQFFLPFLTSSLALR